MSAASNLSVIHAFTAFCVFVVEAYQEVDNAKRWVRWKSFTGGAHLGCPWSYQLIQSDSRPKAINSNNDTSKNRYQ